jgi:hypothetical protein
MPNTLTGTNKDDSGEFCSVTEGEVNGDIVRFMVQCPNKLRLVFAEVIVTDGISGGYIVDDGTFKNHGPFTMVRQ